MEEQQRIETQSKTYRLPVDVIGHIERWAEETGQTPTQCLATCVRVAAEDEKCLARGTIEGEIVLQGEESGANVLQIRMPNNRDALADAITMLMRESRGKVGERDQISALGVARARIYKTTPEYEAANRMRAEKGMPASMYQDEGKLAKMLSAGGGAGDLGGVRQKGDKSR